jgi:hypothetical protein
MKTYRVRHHGKDNKPIEVHADTLDVNTNGDLIFSRFDSEQGEFYAVVAISSGNWIMAEETKSDVEREPQLLKTAMEVPA